MKFPYNTLRQRRKIYTWLIQRIDKGETFLMCLLLSDYLDIPGREVMEVLPELAAERPDIAKPPCWVWADEDKAGMRLRRQALVRSIKVVDRKLAAMEKTKSAKKVTKKKLSKHKTVKR